MPGAGWCFRVRISVIVDACFSVIVDGVGEVRRAVREQVRNRANQIKIMAGGGISSPSDPLEGTQFSVDELRAACEEAEAANL